jgi:hypothetical protein
MSALAPATGYYAYAPDHSVSVIGATLRKSLSLPVVGPTSLPKWRDDRKLIQKVSEAVQHGVSRPHTLYRTLDLLKLLPPNMPWPEIVVESPDRIGLDWDVSPSRVLTITVDDSSRVGYSAVIGHDSHYGSVELCDGTPSLPDALRELLSKVHPSQA